MSVPNFTTTATRLSNGAVTQVSTVVKIAHVAPLITIAKPNHLRSGGSDGTAPQDHLVTVQSNQEMLNTISLTAPRGTWQGSWVYNITNFTRYLRILDTTTKGSTAFTGLSVTNLAGKVVTTATGLGYNVQGFVSRVFNVPAFDYITGPLTPAVVSVVNLVASWSYKSGIQYESTSSRPQIDKYTIMPSGEIRLLDQSATEASSTVTTFTIEEL